MKKQIYLLLLCIVPCLAVFSQTSNTNYQDTVIKHYHTAIVNYNNRYSCVRDKSVGTPKHPNVAGAGAFDTLFKPILSNIFIGSNDLVQDGPASSFTQDPDKGTLSANFTVFSDSARWRLWNMGVFSKATDGIFGIYNTGSWSSEIGVNISQSIILSRGRFFYKDDCKKLDSSGKRQRFYAEYLAKVSKLAVIRDSILARHKKIDSLLKNEWTHPINNIAHRPGRTDSLLTEFAKLDSLKAIIEKSTPGSTVLNDTGYYKSRLDSVVAEFEIKNDIYNGYKVLWLNWHLSLSNNAVALNSDSLDAISKANYSPKNLAKFKAGLNINRISDSKPYGLIFWRGGVDIGLHNYADHPTVKKPGIRYNAAAEKFTVFNNNATYLADYADLKPNIVTFEPSFYFSWFFNCFEKLAGAELRLDIKDPIIKPASITNEIYPTTYTVVLGPSFRLKKDGDISKGTVGIEVGMMDAPVTENAWEYFGAKLKVGVPFSTLIK